MFGTNSREVTFPTQCQLQDLLKYSIVYVHCEMIPRETVSGKKTKARKYGLVTSIGTAQKKPPVASLSLRAIAVSVHHNAMP